jgi:uncharacterized protein YqeY
MTLLAKIKTDLFALRKEGTAKTAISLLTTLYSEAANVGLNDGKRESTDAEVSAVIKKFVKNLDECITVGTAKGIDISLYQTEKGILEVYMPKQLTASEIEAFIIPHVQEGGKPAAMKALKAQYAGQYDGKLAATVVDNLILSWAIE